MTSQIKGPALFLAQFAGSEAPFDTLPHIARWAASLGYGGVQIPTFVPALFDLDRAADSQDYCDEVVGACREAGVEVTELSTHLQGQLVAVNPAYDRAFDAFAPKDVHGNSKARQEWATETVKKAAVASRRMGLARHVGFSGALAWPYLYPWPQRPEGLIEEAFAELARRWAPILDAFAEEGVSYGYELHPGEDLFDGATFEMFLDAVGGHVAATINYDPSHLVLQCLDHLAFIDIYHERITSFHVKDAEFRPDGRQGVYSGYQPWMTRAGRFRSLGDGQVDFPGVFSKLTQYGYDGWAVLEWEDVLKSPEQGAREGARFIERHLIERAARAFDDFAGGGRDQAAIRGMLGL